MTAIADYLEQKAQLIGHELENRLPYTNQRPVLLHEAMRYSTQAGGKRIRPILCIAAAESLGKQAHEILWPALALEIFHTYTLIHDDLPSMDNDDLRRGKPTCHKVYGEANAILAGDALLTLTFEWLARHEPLPPHTTSDFILELATAGGHAGVIAGQVEDLAAERTTPDRETLDFIHRHKTGVLIEAAVRIGAMCGGAHGESLAAYGEYGRHIGLTFQIADDILNVTSNPEALGKGVGTDAARGKTTFVSLCGLDEAIRLARAEAEMAKAALRKLNADTRMLAALADYMVDRSK